MKIHKWLKREKIAPIHVFPGDTVSLTYKDKKGVDHKVLKSDIDKTFTFNEVGIFEAKIEKKDALGGVFIGKKG